MSETGAKDNNFKFGLVIFLIFMAGWTYWNRTDDSTEAKMLCVSQMSALNDIQNPEFICDCTINQMFNSVSFIYHVPILKNFLSEPDMENIYGRSIRSCLGG